MKRREMLSMLTMGSIPIICSGGLANSVLSGQGKETYKSVRRFGDGRDWFFAKRYGMFVHWGIYSIPAWHEQIQWRLGIPRKEYVKFASQFNPGKFSVEQWLDIMQEAGMKYITFTTKHHDGFCMWDSNHTTFNIMNTPYKKDILGMLTDACHKRKVPVSLYYSIADWHHKNYPNLGRHHELSKPEEGDEPDWDKYMDFLKAQVKELCTNYGAIHGFWWDMNVPKYYDPSINDMIRRLQPNAVINNRGFDEGDFGTPERDFNTATGEAMAFKQPTEACQSVDSLSWGYRKEAAYYTDRHLLNSLDRYFSAGANYLLNVGPTDEGLIPEKSVALLKRIGKWYVSVEESFHDAEPVTRLINSPDIHITRKGSIYYVHLNKPLVADGVSLKPINVLPKSAVLLNDGSSVTCSLSKSPADYPEIESWLHLMNLPANEFSNTTLVVRLEFGERIM